MDNKTPAYYRARLELIAKLIHTTPDDGSKNNAPTLLRNGIIMPVLLSGKTEQEAIEDLMKAVHFSNAPLTFSELCRWNTWFTMHPEKVAGTEVVTTSFEFPVTIKGTRQDILDVLTPEIGKKITKPTRKEPWQMTKKEWNKEKEIADAGVQSNLTKGSASEAVDKANRVKNLTYGVHDEISNRLKRAMLPKNDPNHIEMTSEEANDIQFELSRSVSHEDVIKKALSEGKPVPEKVLKEYPGLNRIRIAKVKAAARLKILELMKI